MLEQLLNHLRNWFVVDGGVHEGTFEIEGGRLELPFLVPGQYYRICGSIFNDGVYQYPNGELTSETFEGTVWAMAVPQAVVDISKEIEAWQEKHGNPGPYQSESFGGYTYTRATNPSGQEITWQDAFRSRLNQWRKI